MTISGEQIRRERTRRRLTQQQVAEATGVSLRTVGRIERGEVDESRGFEAVARYLGFKTSDGDGMLLRDASMDDLLRRIREMHDDALRRSAAQGLAYEPGAPDPGLIPGPSTRSDQSQGSDGEAASDA